MEKYFFGDRQNRGLSSPLWLVIPANFTASPQLFLAVAELRYTTRLQCETESKTVRSYKL